MKNYFFVKCLMNEPCIDKIFSLPFTLYRRRNRKRSDIVHETVRGTGEGAGRFKKLATGVNFWFCSSVAQKILKPFKHDEKPREEEGRLSHKDRAEKKVSRSSRSKDRDNRRKRSTSREKNTRRSRSRSLKKQDRLESRKHSKYSKSPEKARNDKCHAEESKKSQRSRSRQKQKSCSRSPQKIAKRKSVTPKRVDKETRHSRSPKRRSPSPKRRNDNRRRSVSARKRSVERRRSLTPKRPVVEQRRENAPEKRRAANSPPPKASMRRRSISRERQQMKNAPRRSSSRNRQQRRVSPVARKRESMRSRSPIPRKASRYSQSPRRPDRRLDRRNERRSKSRSLSYSPARRNPEKYREILNKSNERNRKSGPVVKLHPTTSDRESSDNEVRRSKSIGKVDEFLPIDNIQDNELNRLKALKSELAAKAKESLEKKIISESATTSILVPGKSSRHNDSPPKSSIDPRRARELEIVAQTVAISTKEKQAAIKEREDKTKVKPFKIIEGASPKKNSGESSKASDTIGKARKSRSHSKSSKRWLVSKQQPLKWIHTFYFRSREDSSSSGSSESSSSRGSSRSSHSASSSASSASGHTANSRPRSRHSGSIPRRIGSPSFLDRRRITR